MVKCTLYFSLFLLIQFQNVLSQVTLNADGPGNTYELINSVFASGFNVVEAPDCSHSIFGRHIDEIYDNALNTNVFRFQIHVTPDNDRCINVDRQRNEIKTYDKSPDNLKGIEGETVVYKWKFKLDVGFQVSSSFTHLHQLKSVGGLYSSMPMYTLTARKANPDRLELRYAETDTQTTLTQVALADFKGIWVEAIETIKYGTNSSSNSGTYSIVIKRVSDGIELFNYTNNAIKNWQMDAGFVRPKWGIYRSLNNSSDLRGESVLFANFSIEETETLSLVPPESENKSKIIIPNPIKAVLKFKNINRDLNLVQVFSLDGRKVFEERIKLTQVEVKIDVSSISNGVYIMSFSNNDKSRQTQIIVVAN